MYVSGNPENFSPSDTDLHDPAYGPDGNLVDLGRLGSEALFVWDGADGLENGEYDVFVVTTEPLGKLREADFVSGQSLLCDDDGDGDNLLDCGHAVVDASQDLILDELAVDIEFFTDPDGNNRCWTLTAGDPWPEDATTLDAESFGLIEAAVPSTQGIIHYGTVKVENTYLAMFIRNWAPPGRLNRFSRVVLAPHNRNQGRINVNTATTRAINVDTPDPLFNPLYGVPGILLDWRQATLPDFVDFDDPVAARDLFELAPIDNPTDLDQAIDLATRISNSFRTRLPVGNPLFGEVVHEDGRYYEHAGDLFFLRDADARSVLNYYYPGDIGDDTAFAEKLVRFAGITNLITTRSDVFEIIVTGQSGVGVDADGDGLINWRDDNEFVVTGEKKTRTVYER
jgi:hypothetical protein